MRDSVVIQDFISPIKSILESKSRDKAEHLYRVIHDTRAILKCHLFGSISVDKAVEELSRPAWRRNVRAFDVREWQGAANETWANAKTLLGDVPVPETILYPSFGRSNGRVYRLDGRLVIACSPDFPRSSGDNLRIVVAHEYVHFARWRVTGMSWQNHPIHVSLYEEGLATWLSRQLLPECSLRTALMCDLHRLIGLDDPAGGYVRWCRANLKAIAERVQRHLGSRERKQIHHLFEGGRFRGEKTPIRSGYYLGYRMVEMLAGRINARELFRMKPTQRMVGKWIAELMA